MSSQLDAIRHEVKHTDNTGVVDTCQAIEFIDNGDTLCFIIRRANKVGYTVNDYEMDSAVLVMEQVHALPNELQPIFPRKRSKIERMIVIRDTRERCSTKRLTEVLVELGFRLLRIVMQHRQALGVGSYLKS